ncbi:MAG: hypothetical protein LBB19_03520 [Puniceicoccales bacterium]|nr:hypothetical protein [Puniceicoccales bacterium]
MQLGIQKNASTPHLPEQWRNFEFWLASVCKVVEFERPDLKDVTIERRYEQPFCTN